MYPKPGCAISGHRNAGRSQPDPASRCCTWLRSVAWQGPVPISRPISTRSFNAWMPNATHCHAGDPRTEAAQEEPHHWLPADRGEGSEAGLHQPIDQALVMFVKPFPNIAAFHESRTLRIRGTVTRRLHGLYSPCFQHYSVSNNRKHPRSRQRAKPRSSRYSIIPGASAPWVPRSSPGLTR